MLDKRDELVLVFDVIFYAHNTRLPHVQYNNRVKEMKNFLNKIIVHIIFCLQ